MSYEYLYLTAFLRRPIESASVVVNVSALHPERDQPTSIFMPRSKSFFSNQCDKVGSRRGSARNLCQSELEVQLLLLCCSTLLV